MTGSADDGPTGSPTSSAAREARRQLANRFQGCQRIPFKDRESCVTCGFNGLRCPCLPHQYADKPMQGQRAECRRSPASTASSANKAGGLVWINLGLADQLKRAWATYTGKRRQKADPQPSTRRRHRRVMLEKHGIALDLCTGLTGRPGPAAPPPSACSSFPQAKEHIPVSENGKQRWLQVGGRTLPRLSPYAPPATKPPDPRRREFLSGVAGCPLSKPAPPARSPEQIDARHRSW